MTLGGLPDLLTLTLSDGKGVTVRPVRVGDGVALSAVMNDPNIGFVPSTPSSEEVEHWVVDQAEHWSDEQEDRSLLLAVELHGVTLGMVSARFHLEDEEFEPGAVQVPTIEWSAYRHSSAAGVGLMRRAISLVEPVLVAHYAIRQVMALTQPGNAEAYASLTGYNGPISTSGGDVLFWRRPLE